MNSTIVSLVPNARLFAYYQESYVESGVLHERDGKEGMMHDARLGWPVTTCGGGVLTPVPPIVGDESNMDGATSGCFSHRQAQS